MDIEKLDRISEAEIVNGFVRSKDQNNTLARLMLESHFFVKSKGIGPFGIEQDMWGVGPFIAIQPGEENIIEAIVMGVMVGFRREKGKTDSFNIGLGFVVHPNTRVLGKGFTENELAPAGEDQVRYRETTRSAEC